MALCFDEVTSRARRPSNIDAVHRSFGYDHTLGNTWREHHVLVLVAAQHDLFVRAAALHHNRKNTPIDNDELGAEEFFGRIDWLLILMPELHFEFA